MPPKSALIEIKDLRGGRNGADPPISLPADQCVEALNVDFYEGLLGHKRGGCDAVATTGGTAFSTAINALVRWVPGASEAAAELWAADANAVVPTVKRLAAGTTWADVSFANVASPGWADRSFHAVGHNGKLFLAIGNTGGGGGYDRLLVYDPGMGSPQVRAVGMRAPAAPTVADTGAGAYAATIRYYRVRYYYSDSRGTVRISEPSAAQSFTPSGGGTAARVTKPATLANPTEFETHWMLEASADNSSWWQLSSQVVGTTTYDDSVAPSTYGAGGYLPSDPTGLNTVPTAAKYLVSDGNRLLMAGAFISTGAKYSRVWFTPVLGSKDAGDDERIPQTTTQKNYLDLNENDGGFITGLGGPLDGVPYAFKYRDVWALYPTGEVIAPYIPKRLRNDIGAVDQRGVVLGRDHAGQAALYFWSHMGPYRIVRGHIEYLGRDIEDLTATVNLGATGTVCFGLYYPAKSQVWWWLATGASNNPDRVVVFDARLGVRMGDGQVRKGWSTYTGTLAEARCACLFANTLAASMSRDLKPYVGLTGSAVILKADTTATSDNGTNFQSYIESKPLAVAPMGQNLSVGKSYVLAKASSGVTVTQTLIRNYGVESRTATALLTASGSETRVVKEFEASALSQAHTIQVRLGDGAAQAVAWTLEGWAGAIGGEERE